jgi:hypothetical protein
MSREFSVPMSRLLRDVIHGAAPELSKNTCQALVRRGLLSHDGTLTPRGWRHAIVLLPLHEQCERMELQLEQLPNPDPDVPAEVAAWGHFSALGFVGSHCEGGAILVLIRAACLDLLASLNVFHSRSDACIRFTEAQLSILGGNKSEILSAVGTATIPQVARNFGEIYSHQLVGAWYPSLTVEGITSLFAGIGPRRLAEITAAVMEDPYTYRAGWPDLTMVRDGSVLWAEVKTSDRLHMRQVVTLSRMKGLLPGSVRIVQLV